MTQVNPLTAQTMSSLEIASFAGKRHDNVIRDIRAMFDEMQLPESVAQGFLQSETYNRNNTHTVYNLPQEYANQLLLKYSGYARSNHHGREEAALRTIESLYGITLERQYKVGKYRLDGYHPGTNTAYEIDEESHKYKSTQDTQREQEIIALLGCTFVRVSI